MWGLRSPARAWTQRKGLNRWTSREVPWVSLHLGLMPFSSLLGLTASHSPSILYLSLTEFYPLFLLRGNNSQLFMILVVSCFWGSSKIGIPWTDEKVSLHWEHHLLIYFLVKPNWLEFLVLGNGDDKWHFNSRSWSSVWIDPNLKGRKGQIHDLLIKSSY